ncbi:DUF397 domain-containing protein [Streptomyces sp. PSAA01]|uniref:DUF397 domain-containing protein n=1 Tax=Streptomyces sp. PSAA01 TaxID=2912762 RepID=UPI001F1E4011|nr:DUF397 domain-containing protein [Streptomyces sp. PSAA01]MCG0290329.1 DUF397 domain-containing protein [Streptomyces sp. PSAA01]
MSAIPDRSGTEWVKSSYSGNGGGSCVEWAPDLASAGIVPVRDSKDPYGPVLAFPVSSWSSFISAVKGGQLPTA